MCTKFAEKKVDCSQDSRVLRCCTAAKNDSTYIIYASSFFPCTPSKTQLFCELDGDNCRGDPCGRPKCDNNKSEGAIHESPEKLIINFEKEKNYGHRNNKK